MKLLNAEYVEPFLRGNIYMNSSMYFANLDGGDKVRSDRSEGLHWAYQVQSICIAKDGCWLPIQGLINPVTHRTPASSGYNMFCLYTFNSDPQDSFDSRNLGFGDSFVIIHNLKEFVERVKVAVECLGRELNCGLVQYVDRNSYHGPMGPFRKIDDFAYQNEFRFVLAGGMGDAITLQIGDLTDIATAGNALELNSLIHKVKGLI